MRYTILLILFLTGLNSFSNEINLDNFNLNSYCLKSYSSSDKLLSEVKYDKEHKATGINRYYYNKKNQLERVEYYNPEESEPDFALYRYDEDKLIEVKSYFKNNRLKSMVKYFYKGDKEVKREYYNSQKKLMTTMINFFNDKDLKIKTEYKRGNKIIQSYIYSFTKDNKVDHVKIYDSQKMIKEYRNIYSSDNLEYICFYNSSGYIEKVIKNSYDSNKRLIEYREFIK